MAEAMECKVVYGLVPLNGKTLEELAEERMWREVLGVPRPMERGTKGPRGQGAKGSRGHGKEADEQAA